MFKSTDAYVWPYNDRIAGFDGYQPPLYPDRIYDAHALVNIAKEIDANVIRISAMGKLAHFKTDQWEVDDYIKDHDFLQELIELAHSCNIKVVPYVPGAHCLPMDLIIKWHPEWLQRAYPNQPLEEAMKTMSKCHSGTTVGFVCPIGPYREFYMSMVREVVLNHDVDGWYTDGWKHDYFKPVCYCSSCREKFKADTGEDLYDEDFAPGGARSEEVYRWYYRKVVEMVQEAHAMVRKVKRVPTMINHISGILGYQHQGPWGKDVDPIHDIMHFERKTEPYDRLASASYINLLGERAWIYAGIYSPFQIGTVEQAEENYADERRFPFRKELYNEAFITFACGQGVNLIRANSFFFDKDSPGKKIVKDIYGTVKNNPEAFEGAEYYPFVGVLNQEIERWNFKGPWFRALVKKGIQVSIFKKEDMDNLSFLKKLTVLISDDIDEENQKKMLKYVRCGGRWITTDDVRDLASPNFVELGGTEKVKAFLCGRGVIYQIEKDISEDDLFNAVLFASDGYVPYRVSISSGELIPILSTKPGIWVLHLVNISKHLKGNFESGLEYIPGIETVDIEFNLPDGAEIDNAYMLRSHEEVRFDGTGRHIRTKVSNLEEYDAIVIRFK